MCQRLEKSFELLEAVLSLILLINEGNDASLLNLPLH